MGLMIWKRGIRTQLAGKFHELELPLDGLPFICELFVINMINDVIDESIVVCDHKLEDLMIDEQMKIKIIYFGFAKKCCPSLITFISL